jgi:hypothetical protein
MHLHAIQGLVAGCQASLLDTVHRSRWIVGGYGLSIGRIAMCIHRLRYRIASWWGSHPNKLLPLLWKPGPAPTTAM